MIQLIYINCNVISDDHLANKHTLKIDPHDPICKILKHKSLIINSELLEYSRCAQNRKIWKINIIKERKIILNELIMIDF